MTNDNLNAKVLNTFSEEDLKILTKLDRKRIIYNIRDDVRHEIDGEPLSEVVKYLTEKMDDINNNDATFHCEYDYDGCIDVEIRYMRTETDEEYAARLRNKIYWYKEEKKRQAKKKENVKEKEKAQLKKLIKKYGVPNDNRRN